MPIYKCNKCEYTTKVKQNLNKHVNKKSPCKTELIIYDVSNNDNDNEPIAIGSIEGHLLEINDELEKVKNEKLDLQLFNDELIKLLDEMKEKYKKLKKQLNTQQAILNELGIEYEILEK
jgi:predicted transcriptional regulator